MEVCTQLNISPDFILATTLKDLSLGERIKLPELRRLVDSDPTYQNLTTEEEDELKQEVLDHREKKKVGVHLVFVSPVLRPIQDWDRTGKRPEKTGPVVFVFHFQNRKTAKRPVLKDRFTSVRTGLW